MKNNFINDSADYADFRDFIKNAVATDYADYVYFRNYMKKKKFTTDYTDHVNF